MNCRQCGSRIPDKLLKMDAFRCPRCGKPYRRRATPVQSKSNKTAYQHRKRPLDIRKKIFGGGVLLFLTFVIVVIVVISNNRKHIDTTTQANNVIQGAESATTEPVAVSITINDYMSAYNENIKQFKNELPMTVIDGNSDSTLYSGMFNVQESFYGMYRESARNLEYIMLWYNQGYTDNDYAYTASVFPAALMSFGKMNKDDATNLINNLLDTVQDSNNYMAREQQDGYEICLQIQNGTQPTLLLYAGELDSFLAELAEVSNTTALVDSILSQSVSQVPVFAMTVDSFIQSFNTNLSILNTTMVDAGGEMGNDGRFVGKLNIGSGLTGIYATRENNLEYVTILGESDSSDSYSSAMYMLDAFCAALISIDPMSTQEAGDLVADVISLAEADSIYDTGTLKRTGYDLTLTIITSSMFAFTIEAA